MQDAWKNLMRQVRLHAADLLKSTHALSYHADLAEQTTARSLAAAILDRETRLNEVLAPRSLPHHSFAPLLS
jgi:hypothetical protein